MRYIFTILILLANILTFAQNQINGRRIPAVPHPIEHIQPNGDTLIYRLHGDERRHWQTTLDGYLIAQNKKGKMCYAKQTKNGKIITTRRTAHNATDRCKCEQRYVEKHITNTERTTE